MCRESMVWLLLIVNYMLWLQSQYPNGRRGSASVAMLTSTVRKLENFYLKVQ